MYNYNAATECEYSEKNQSLLEAHKEAFELVEDAWAGFKQWHELGRKVKKGAKACKVYMFCKKKIEGDVTESELLKNDDDKNKKTVMKMVCVFNVEHTEAISD